MAKNKSHKGARDSRTGQFIKLSEATRRRSTTQVESIPNPGYGTTGRGKVGKKK